MTDAFLTKLMPTTLDDIQIAGFVDEDDSLYQFSAQLRLMYLELDGRLLELRCIDDTGTLAVRLSNELAAPAELDDDLRPCVASIRELSLTDPDGKNQVEVLTLWGASFDEELATCSALQLELDNGQVLFADPSYHFGIRLGGTDQRERWYQNWPGARSLQMWSTSSTE